MSLSVPQNGVKADNEPVIELFVKVRHGTWDKFLNFEVKHNALSAHSGDSSSVSIVEEGE